MTIPSITITDSAAHRVAHLVSLEKSAALLRLRISVGGGGCSGFQYYFTLDDAQTLDDQTFEKNGVSIILDTISLSLLSDTLIDYVEDPTSAQFVIKNSTAAASSGCGNSPLI